LSPDLDRMEKTNMKPLYTAIVVADGGGRAGGRVHDTEPPLDLPLALATPRSLGGPGDATNPEELFAAGYAACSESSLRVVARLQKRALDEVEISSHVTLVEDDDGALRIAVALHGRMPGVEREEAQSLMESAHKVCPAAIESAT
jgi:lipoyl-dependent peroxiredoxin